MPTLGILINTYTYNPRRKHPNYKITNCSKSKTRTKKRKDVAVFFTNEVTGNPCGLCAQRHGAGVEAPVQAQSQARVGNPTAQADQPQVRVQTLMVRTGVGSGTHGQAGDGGQTQTIRSQAHRTITLRSLKAHRLKPYEARLIEP
ncbi:hypothetical protein YC2023_078362 [Brassica napus]